MKRFFFCLLFIFSFCLVFSEIPENFRGIWQGKDRYIFFDEEHFSIILKEYYGWYLDRVQEPQYFLEAQKRTVNLATTKEGYNYNISFEKLTEDAPVWEMTIFHEQKISSTIPVALSNNKLYLDFLIKVPYDTEQDFDTTEEKQQLENKRTLYGYWEGLNTCDSIRISPRKEKDNIISWYVTENGIYRLRFWKTKMNFEESKAIFTDSGKLFTINKHILSAKQNYTCVSGRGSNIRNVEKFSDLPSGYELDESGNLLVSKNFYLEKLEPNTENAKTAAEELLSIIKTANSKRKPPRPPLFPLEELDWHLDLIEQLEKDNIFIKEFKKSLTFQE